MLLQYVPTLLQNVLALGCTEYDMAAIFWASAAIFFWTSAGPPLEHDLLAERDEIVFYHNSTEQHVQQWL